MKTMEGIIKEIIEHELGKCPWCLFTSNHSYFQFKCRYSSLDNYVTEEEYSIYQLGSLERFLAKKNQMLSPKGLKEFYEDKDQQVLCYIIDWSTQTKIVLMIRATNTFITNEQIQNTLETIGKNRKRISDVYTNERNQLNG